MPTFVTPLQDGPVVKVPNWVQDNASFLRWMASGEALESGKYGFFRDVLWIDHTMERLLHALIKSAVAFGIMKWAEQNHLGQYYMDRMLFTCPEIELSSEPDGFFVLASSLQAEKVRFPKGLESEVMQGPPDLVLEVISKSSVRKDTVILRELYHEAGVAEYWLIDSREQEAELKILRSSVSGYVSVRPQEGFVVSKVLGARFRLVVDREREKVWLERK